MGNAPSDEGGRDADHAERILRAAEAGRSRLLADARMIDALVRIDEIDVAGRAVEEQRADLVEYAIDLREAVADAVRRRDGDPDEEPAG